MTNLSGMMTDNGLRPEHFFSATIFMTDFDSFPAINAVWERFVAADGPLPARTSVAVTALPAGACVEAEFTFYREAR